MRSHISSRSSRYLSQPTKQNARFRLKYIFHLDSQRSFLLSFSLRSHHRIRFFFIKHFFRWSTLEPGTATQTFGVCDNNLFWLWLSRPRARRYHHRSGIYQDQMSKSEATDKSVFFVEFSFSYEKRRTLFPLHLILFFLIRMNFQWG